MANNPDIRKDEWVGLNKTSDNPSQDRRSHQGLGLRKQHNSGSVGLDSTGPCALPAGHPQKTRALGHFFGEQIT
eukprot:1147131-Pelagomonas_calceolata.AAC.1